jgi:hypothetical protein
LDGRRLAVGHALAPKSRREAIDAARAAIAEWLEMRPDTFDVES